MDENKREAQRQKVLKGARILLDDLRTLDCSIKDISATGAKIACPNTLNIPDVFRLVTTADNIIRPAKVAWRREGLIGIHFTGDAKPSALRRAKPVAVPQV